MAKFSVIVTRDITESTTVLVKAENESAVKDLSVSDILGDGDVEWFVDDGSWNNGDPYVTDITPAFVKYSHAFDFAFELTSEDEEAEDVTPAMLRAALIKRASEISDAEIMEACGCIDTFEVSDD